MPSDNAYHEGVLGDTGPAVDDDSFAGKEPNRVLGGFKTTLCTGRFFSKLMVGGYKRAVRLSCFHPALTRDAEWVPTSARVGCPWQTFTQFRWPIRGLRERL